MIRVSDTIRFQTDVLTASLSLKAENQSFKMARHIILRRHFGCWPLHDPFLKQVLIDDPSNVNPTPQLKLILLGWVVLEPKIQPLKGGGSKPQSCPTEKRPNEYSLYYTRKFTEKLPAISKKKNPEIYRFKNGVRNMKM